MRRYTLCRFCFAVTGLLFLTVLWTGGWQDGSIPEVWSCPVTAAGTVGRVEEKQNGYGQKQSILSLHAVAFCSGSFPNQNEQTIETNKSGACAEEIVCYLAEGEEIPLTGERIIVSGQAEGFRRRRNPGGFDAALYYRSQGVLFSMQQTKVVKREGRCDVFGQTLYVCRRYMQSILEAVCQEDAGIMRSILLGDKNALPPEIRALYQKGGISHILAISGLHISFLGIGFYRLCKRSVMPVPAAVILTCLFLFSYVVMTGGSVSAWRAFLMCAVSLAADVAGRSYERMTALSVSALLLTLRWPMLFWQSGFWLSYGAILGLELVCPILTRLWDNRLAKLFLPGLAVSLVTLPVLLRAFFEFPVCSLAWNVLVIPLMGVVMALGTLALLAGMVFVPLGRIVFLPVHILLCLFELVCGLSERISWNMWGRGAPGWVQVFLYYVLLLCFCLMKKYMTKPCALLMLLGAVWIVRCPLLPQDTLTVLDVGQGDGIVVQSGDGTAVLIDGGSTSEKQLARYTLVPYLKSEGVRELSYVFLTHMDADHVNGVETLIQEGRMEQIRIDTLVLPAIAEQDEDYRRIVSAAREAGIRLCVMGAGDAVETGGFRFSCLHPQRGAAYADRNDGSLVIYLTKGRFSALFMGDLDGEAETAFAQRYSQKLRNVTVLKVGHHGSGASCTEAFLSACSPQIAVISCGEKNRYGHPAKETLERLSCAGSRIYVTKDTGAVEIVIGEERARVSVQAQGWGKPVAASKDA